MVWASAPSHTMEGYPFVIADGFCLYCNVGVKVTTCLPIDSSYVIMCACTAHGVGILILFQMGPAPDAVFMGIPNRSKNSHG